MSCSDYPTAQTAKTFKLDAETTNDVVTLEQDRTSAASDGKTKKTFWGIENDATLQRDNIDQLAETQRENLESTFTAQFAYKRIGNISAYVGQSLPESEKLNSYQYPDDSGEWYGPVQDQAFPITIPADPSSNNGWALVNSLTSSSLPLYTDIVFKASGGNSAIENMILEFSSNPLSYAVGTILKTGGTTWEYSSSTGPISIENFRIFDVLCLTDFKVPSGGDDSSLIQDALNTASTKGVATYAPSNTYILNNGILPNDGQILFGDGDTTIFDGSACTGDGVIHFIGKSYGTIEKIKLIYNSSEPTSGVVMDGCNNITVRNNLIETAPNDINVTAVRVVSSSLSGFSQTKKIQITENRIFSPSLAVLCQSQSNVYTEDVSITNNIVTMNQTSGLFEFTVGIIKVDKYCRNTVISSNVLDGGGNAKAFIQAEEGIDTLTISSNSIRDCAPWGIRLYDGQLSLPIRNITITGNSILNAGIDVGLGGSPVCENISITSNVVIDSPDRGINADLSDTVEGLLIDGNTVKNPTLEGIYVRSPKSIVTNNHVDVVASDCLELRNAGNSTVSGNILKTVDGRVITIFNSPQLAISSNQIEMTNSTQLGAVVYLSGSFGGDAYSGNIFKSGATHAVYFNGTEDICTFTGNNFVSGNIRSGDSHYRYGNIGITNYRESSGDPTGVFTPPYVGAEAFDGTSGNWYKSTGATSSDWKLIT